MTSTRSVSKQSQNGTSGQNEIQLRSKVDKYKHFTREIVVDLIHLKNNIVRHAGFSQQHVQLPRHAPSDGVDAKPAPANKILHTLLLKGQLVIDLCITGNYREVFDLA